MKDFEHYAGFRSLKINTETGTINVLYDGIPAGLDTDAGRWQTVCEDHGAICAHRTLKLAQRHNGFSEEWCADCRDTILAKEGRSFMRQGQAPN